MALTLPEEVLLVAFDPGRGRVTASAPASVAIAGAVAADLVERGAARLEGSRLVAAAPVTAGPAFCDEALAEVRRELREHDLRWWLRRLSAPRWRLSHRVLASLVARGVLQPRPARLLGIFPVARYDLVVPAAREEVVERVRSALLGDGGTDLQTRTLAAVLAAGRLTGRVAAGRERKLAASRGAALLRGDRSGPAVDRAVRELETEVAAAVIAATGTGSAAGPAEALP